MAAITATSESSFVAGMINKLVEKSSNEEAGSRRKVSGLLVRFEDRRLKSASRFAAVTILPKAAAQKNERHGETLPSTSKAIGVQNWHKTMYVKINNHLIDLVYIFGVETSSEYLSRYLRFEKPRKTETGTR